MAVALNPTIATRTSNHLVEIETTSPLTRGMTVVDRLNVAHDERNRGDWPNHATRRPCSIVWEIDVPNWKALLLSRLR